MGGTRRRRVLAVVAVVAVLVGLTACEGAIEQNVERLLAPETPSRSAALKAAARERSQAMCATGAVLPTPDPVARYGPGVVELVDSQPLDPNLDPPDDDHAATSAIWRRFEVDPALADGPYRWSGVGEARCADGRLYMTLLLQAPPVDPSTLTSISRARGLSLAAAISGDGRYVAFSSSASDLASPPTTSVHQKIHLWDSATGDVVRITDDSGSSIGSSLSADGGVLTFMSSATSLASGTPIVDADVFVWSRATGAVSRITSGDAISGWPEVSADGRYVAFSSAASDLVAGDVNGVDDVFVHDRQTGITSRITDGDGPSRFPSISGDGSVVAFQTLATDLAPGGNDGRDDIALWRRATGTIEVIGRGDGPSVSASLSADGQHVAWSSFATDLVPGDDGGWSDVFVRDVTTGVVTSVTAGATGSSYDPDLSTDGSVIALWSSASDLAPGDHNGWADVLTWERATGTFTRRSDGSGDSTTPAVSADGLRVAFQSNAPDLLPGDLPDTYDVFLSAEPG